MSKKYKLDIDRKQLSLGLVLLFFGVLFGWVIKEWNYDEVVIYFLFILLLIPSLLLGIVFIITSITLKGK